MSWKELAAVQWGNLRTYFQLSTRYDNHVIADNLMWRKPYKSIFRAPTLPCLIILAGAFWMWRARREALLTGLGLALPGLFIFSISVLCEAGENMRYKFFLEPLFFVLIVSQLLVVGRDLRLFWRAKLR